MVFIFFAEITEMAHPTFSPPKDAVMTAFPLRLQETTPLLVTFATLGLEEDHLGLSFVPLIFS